MLFEIVTLFPEMFPPVLGTSILKRGAEAGLLSVRLHNIRSYTTDRHHTADDYPYGGGAGMVMKPEPIFRAVEAALDMGDAPPGITMGDVPAGGIATTTLEPRPGPVPVILMGPSGRPFTHEVALELAGFKRLLLICGHYEGIDERVREHLATDEISIGDYVLTGGELPAMVVVDAVARLLPGVLAEGSAQGDSHADGLLEHPQYTRPPYFRGWGVPPVLVSGHHAQVAAWRRKESLRLTRQRRPDLIAKAALTPHELRWLAEIEAEEQAPASNAAIEE